MIDIREANEAEVKSFLGFCPRGLRQAFGAFDGDRAIGLCGIIRDPAYVGSILEEEGRWIAFFDTEKVPMLLGMRFAHSIKHFLRSQEEEIWVYCESRHSTAERFLDVLGFIPTDEIRPNWRNPSEKLRMWKWQG